MAGKTKLSPHETGTPANFISVKGRTCIVFVEICTYSLSQREHGRHSRPPCATCCRQDGKPLAWEGLSLTWPLITAGWGKTAARFLARGMCGPGACYCVRRGAGRAGANPQGARQSGGSAGPRRGVAAAVQERCGSCTATAPERCRRGGCKASGGHRGASFPLERSSAGSRFPGKRLVSANESPAVLLPRLSVCC